MKAQDLIDALQIIETARPENVSPYHIRAEHDMIYAGGANHVLSEEQRVKLEELGAQWNESIDGWELSL